MRVSLKLQGEELMVLAAAVPEQLAATGDGIGDAVDSALEDKAEAGLKKIG